jgi:hypothetical protein
VDVEEDVWERAVDAGCCCSGVKGVRCFVVLGVDGEVGTKRGEKEVSGCKTGNISAGETPSSIP